MKSTNLATLGGGKLSLFTRHWGVFELLTAQTLLHSDLKYGNDEFVANQRCSMLGGLKEEWKNLSPRRLGSLQTIQLI